jgi:hypothetical protein
VDAKHHLIVAHEVGNTGTDRDQLAAMSKVAQQEIGTEELTAIAAPRNKKSASKYGCPIYVVNAT